MEQGAHAERLHRVLRQADLARNHQRQHRHVQRVEVELLAADLVAHDVDRQLGRREDRIGNLPDQLAGLGDGLLRIAQQILFNVPDRLCRVDKSVFDTRCRFALHLDLLDQRALGSQRWMLLQHRFFGRCGIGGLFRLARLWLAFAACRIKTHALQSESANRRDLVVVLDLEVIEGERVLEPLQVYINVHADLKLIDTHIGQIPG